MTIFSYIMVLVSVVLSLGLAHLLTGLAALVRARRRVRWSLTYCLWLVEAVSLHLNLWTSMWTLQGQTVWSLVSVIALLTAAGTIYFTCALLIPERVGEGEIDLTEYHATNRREYLPGFMAYLVTALVLNVSLFPPDALGDLIDYAYLLPNLALLALAFFRSDKWVQRGVPMAILAMDALYFATTFPTIGNH